MKVRAFEIISVYKRYLPRLNLKIIPIPQHKEINEFSGPIPDKDVPVLVSAIQGKADFLVTGDKHHFEKLKSPGKYPFHIGTPSELLDHILPEVLKEIGKID